MFFANGITDMRNTTGATAQTDSWHSPGSTAMSDFEWGAADGTTAVSRMW